MTEKPWLRLYTALLDEPKVQRLSDEDFRHWINSLCVAGRCDGKLPSAADMAFLLRADEETVNRRNGNLVRAGLLDEVDGVLEPHNWERRQYKSDTSTERVRKHRQKHAPKRNVSGNVSGNGGETVSRNAPEQSRAERNVPKERSSLRRAPPANGAEHAPPKIFVAKSDRRAAKIEERYRREHGGRPPPWGKYDAGYGWYAPKEWFEEEAA